MQNVNLFFTTSLCLLACQIHCHLFTLPAASLNKFMETLPIRVSSICAPGLN